MSLIQVKNLHKSFSYTSKKPGIRNALWSLFKPEVKTIEAVKDVSFSVEEGEIVAFMGPNGAGKSTTIKMLTGILTPNLGEATVCGKTPWKLRQKLAFEIGTVFGQKSQLWFHLPATDSFELFSKMYEIPREKFEKRRDELVKRFDAESFVNQPVRKLSLGQRMKCEVIASLLHSPKILFLDEPTIGLDIIAKRKFREEIKRLNQEEHTTIFLTSHDVSDLEKLCKRIMIINHGQLIYDNKLSELKREYFKTKIIDVLFEKEIPHFKKKGIKVVKRSKDALGLKLEIDVSKIKIDDALTFLAKKGDISDITIEDPPVEEIIEEIYSRKN